MKKTTCIIIALITGFATAQTTFDINWVQGTQGAAASLTIETGDLVRWTWGNGSPHSVTSLTGSQETFDSGIITGMGTQFSYTFTQIGTNPYQCNVHPGSMNGTITVTTAMTVEEKFVQNLHFYPNPVEDEMTLFSLFKLDGYEIYNVQGQLLIQGRAEGNFTNINVAGLRKGVYLVKAKADNMESVIRIVIER